MLFKGKALIVGLNALKGETSYLGERLGVGDVAAGVDYAVPGQGCCLRQFRQ